jgi:gliding motility-associated lipoprotein GldH
MFPNQSSFLAPLLLAAVVFMSSCDNKRFFEENTAVEKGLWKADAKIRFEVPVNDTSSFYNFYLNVRNSTDYPYSNLYLFIRTTSPAGKIALDTVDCPLADYSGKWLGTGFGSIKFNRCLVQSHLNFRKKGQYIFELEQAMREKELKGIMDVGIRIEKEPR